MTIRLEQIRDCLEGLIPGHIATCDAEGVPNLAYLSQVEFIDNEHLALSYQFFNRTRQNILAGSAVRLLVTSHLTGAQFRLSLEYLRTETVGPLFEQMKAKLAGIAAHSGMAEIFKLLGADIYRVQAIEQVPGPTLPMPPLPNRLSALRRAAGRLAACGSLEALLDETMRCVVQEFGIGHAMLLMHDEARGCLYTLSSHGYPASGIGSEIVVGAGLIGICARERSAIRVGFTNSEYGYGRTVRDSLLATGHGHALETAIPLPGLPDAASQMALPITAHGQLLGVLYVESVEAQHFGYDEEDALVTFAAQLGLAMLQHQQAEQAGEDAAGIEPPGRALGGTPLRVKRLGPNDSLFLDDEYLIKGVAGAILWALLSDFTAQGRTQFSNRELRVDPRIRLPGISDNLEARLVLLQRRLDERNVGIRLVKTGRGRFALAVDRPVQLLAN